jgi:hypothetical protein
MCQSNCNECNDCGKSTQVIYSGSTVGIQSITDLHNGSFKITLTNGAEYVVETIPGTNGTNGTNGTSGAAGESITITSTESTTVSEGTQVTITFSDDTELQFIVAKGVQGISGTNGNTISAGTVLPLNSVGNNGDQFINTTTWNFYTKEAGSWTLKGNIKGVDGINGVDGTDGEDGIDGVDGLNGSAGAAGRSVAVYLSPTAPTGGTYYDGDVWITP